MTEAATGPLAGIRVVDLTRILAGPLCTMMLGDMGADVIKVEPPDKGDDTRSWGPPFAGHEAAYFLGVNRNKRSLTLNMAVPAGQKVLAALIGKADVLIDNFRLGTLEKWGFTDAWFEHAAPRSGDGLYDRDLGQPDRSSPRSRDHHIFEILNHLSGVEAGAVAVGPPGARLEVADHPGEAGDVAGQRLPRRRDRVVGVPLEDGLQSRGVRQQVPDGDLALGGHLQVRGHRVRRRPERRRGRRRRRSGRPVGRRDELPAVRVDAARRARAGRP